MNRMKNIMTRLLRLPPITGLDSYAKLLLHFYQHIIGIFSYLKHL